MIAEQPHQRLPSVTGLKYSISFFFNLIFETGFTTKSIFDLVSVLGIRQKQIISCFYVFIFTTSKVSHEKTVLELFQESSFGTDLFSDSSDLKDVLVYCRGSKRLQIPSAEWRAALPKVL